MTPSNFERTSATICARNSVQRAAVGIAEAEHVGAGVLRGFEGAQREIAVMDVAVEEVLGVVDDFFAVVFQIADGFRDDGEVFVFGDAERAVRHGNPSSCRRSR